MIFGFYFYNMYFTDLFKLKHKFKGKRFERKWWGKTYNLNLKISRNNLMFTINKSNGELLTWWTVRTEFNIKNIGRVDKYLIMDLLEIIVTELKLKQYLKLNIKFRGFIAFNRMFKKISKYFIKNGFKLISVLYYSRLPHNGCYTKKVRRK